MHRFRYLISLGREYIDWTLLLVLLTLCIGVTAASTPLFGASSCPVFPTRSSDNSSSFMCTFSNPGYSGECRESGTLKEGETAGDACNSILQCLNNVRCEKTYCGATTVREGWKLESAKETPEKK